MRRLLIATFLAAAPAAAQVANVGDLAIDAPMLREAPPAAPVAGGFLTITNAGDADDALVSASVAADVAGEVQLHEMAMSGGVMTMREVEGGIRVPAGETVALAPGGLHLMLMDLASPLVAGEARAVTLTFERAGSVTLDFPVMTLEAVRAAGQAEAGHGGHGAHGGAAARPGG